MRTRLAVLLLCIIAVGLPLSGCFDQENQPPRARFTFSPKSPRAGEPVIFDGSGSSDPDGQVVSHTWAFGDGTEAFGAIATHIYAEAGFYTVTLTVTDDRGAAGSASQEVVVLSGPVVGSIPAPGEDPQGLAWDGTSLWNVDATELKLFRLNPETGTVLKELAIEIEAEFPTGLAWDGQSFWLLDASALVIYRLDTEGEVVEQIPAPGSFPQGLAWDGESLWVSDFEEGKLYRIQPGNGAVLKTLKAPAESLTGLAWDGSHLWVADLDTQTIYKLSPSGGQPLSLLDAPGPESSGLTWDGSHLWVADLQNLRIYKISPP